MELGSPCERLEYRSAQAAVALSADRVFGEAVVRMACSLAKCPDLAWTYDRALDLSGCKALAAAGFATVGMLIA